MMRIEPRPESGGFSLATIGVVAVLAASALLYTGPVAAQTSGISLAITPTAERIYWDSDLVLGDAWYYGGRASLGFGRYVALQGYYLHGEDVGTPTLGTFDTARRYGGEVEFTFADWRLTPFVRAGAALTEFGFATATDAVEILSATGAAGVRLRLFDRLETQLFVQDVAFQLAAGSPLVAPGVIPDGETATFHNLALGAGVNLRLGGETAQPETDRAFQGGVRGLRSPLQLYAGEIRWDGGIGIPDVTVGGARLGLDFGPYVGIRGYYFGSLEDDLDEFTRYFGYGAEGRFNLTRRNASLTPFLVLGGGRIHFPGSIAGGAVFEDDRKWNAVAGGGVEFRLGDRFGLSVSARDLILSGVEPGSTTDPDQLHHNWLFSGGLQLSLGAGAERARPGRAEPAPVAAEPAVAAESAVEAREAADPELGREIRSLRAEVDSLRRDLRRLAAGQYVEDSVTARAAVRPSPRTIESRTIELPVLDRGVIYIRFGEAEAAQAAAPPDTEVAGAQAADRVQALLDELESRLEARADVGSEHQAERARLERLERLMDERLASLERELRTLQRTPAPHASPVEVRVETAGEAASEARQAERARLERLERLMDERLDSLERELRTLQRTPPQASPVEVRVEAAGEARQTDAVPGPRRAHGLFKGDRVGLYRIAPELAFGLGAGNSVLLGLKADIGSAFGGPLRVLPELLFGVTGDGTWNANLHLEWPVPFEVVGVRPWFGAGAGILHDGGTDLLFPNILAGVTYPVGSHQLFGTLQGLDLFDQTRFLVGLSLRLPPFLRPGEPGTVASAELVEPPPVPGPDSINRALPEPVAPAAPDMSRPEAPVRPDPVETPGTAAAVAPETPAERAPSIEEVLLREMADLVGSRAVLDVRRTDRGVTVVLGGSDLFPTGGAALTSGARSTLRLLAERLIRRPELTVAVEGHTDDRGPPSVNDPLSRRRAESVRDALVSYGVTPARVAVNGYGARRPIAGNATTAGRAQNRRVEVTLMTDR